MTLTAAFVLGLIQGLTEFLPVSSSGHLILAPAFLGWAEQPISFDVALHMGTLLAIFVALRADIAALTGRLFDRDIGAWKFAGVLVLATIPAVIFGGLGGDLLDSLRTPKVIAFMLVSWGVLLSYAEIVSRRVRKTEVDPLKVGPLKGLAIGIVQALALLPGTSRSGGTLTAGIFLGLSREAAVRFSFLLGIPAILGAGVKTAYDVSKTGIDVGALPLLVGFVTSLLVGIFAIRLLLLVTRRWSLHVFTAYRIALAVVVWLVLVR